MRHETFTRFAAIPTTTRDEDGVVYVEAVVAAGADVQRGDWIERLPATPEVWNPLPESVPLLDNHRNGSVRDVIGSAGNFRFEGGQLLATLRITDSAIAEQVKRGSPLKLSMGYRHLKRHRTVENGKRVENVTAARLGEVSLVIHPADPSATMRSESPMPTEQLSEAQQTRAAIREVARTAGLPADWADAQIDGDATLEAARSAAFEAMAARRTAAPIRAAVGFSNEDPAVVTRRMAEALAADAAGVPVTDEGATQYRGLGFRGLARLAVEGQAGARFLSDAAMIDAAFTREAGASLSVSDYPSALLGAGNRIVGHAYGEAVSPIESNLVVYGTAADFRPVTEAQLSGLPNLKPLTENGEIQAVAPVESGTSWQLGTYAARIDVSRKMLVNDDLGLFGRLSAELGRAARRTETAAIVALLVSNPVMADGKALFHADHGNLAASGGSPDINSLTAAVQAIQAQRGLGGEVIGLRPAYLVVAPAVEFVARRLVSEIYPTTAADVNPLAGLLEVLVEPRLTGTAWFVFAKPAAAPVLKVAHLAGQSGPVVQTQERWNGLGTSFRAFTDFGTTAVDWRGAYKNAGA